MSKLIVDQIQALSGTTVSFNSDVTITGFNVKNSFHPASSSAVTPDDVVLGASGTLAIVTSNAQVSSEVYIASSSYTGSETEVVFDNIRRMSPSTLFVDYTASLLVPDPTDLKIGVRNMGRDDDNPIDFTVGWVPDNLENLVSWFDASKESTITKDGINDVTAWTARAGTSPEVLRNNGTANACPVYESNAINGLGALKYGNWYQNINCSGGKAYSELTSSATYMSGNSVQDQFTLAVLFRPMTNVNNGAVIGSNASDPACKYSQFAFKYGSGNNTTSPDMEVTMEGSTFYAMTVTDDVQNFVSGSTRGIIADVNAGSVSIYMAPATGSVGIPEKVKSISDGDVNYCPSERRLVTGQGLWRYGAYGCGFRYDGYICEIIFVSGSNMSIEEIKNLQNYWTSKWGL